MWVYRPGRGFLRGWLRGRGSLYLRRGVLDNWRGGTVSSCRYRPCALGKSAPFSGLLANRFDGDQFREGRLLCHGRASGLLCLGSFIARSLRGFSPCRAFYVAPGTVRVVQSRAVTTQPTDLFSAVDGRWVLFKPLIENFSEPLTPMTVDLLRRVLPPIGTFIHGWYYLNLARLQRFSPRRMDDAALARVLLLRDSGISATWNWTGVLRGAVLLVVGYLSAGAFWSRTSRAPAQGLSVFTAHCESVLADPGCDPLRALQRLMHTRHPLRPVGEFPLQVNIASGRYFLLFGMLKRLLNRLAPGFDQSKLAFLCSGGEGMISRLMVEEIQALGELARTDPEIGSALLERDGDTQALLGRLDPDHPFAAALAGFLQRYGHRTLRELELATPRWRERTVPRY